MASVTDIVELIKNTTNIMVLSGAGMSAESGLPTFRGEDGYWVKDGKNYHPMDLATYRTFAKDPETVWEWYHHRRKVYRDAEPNPGHLALVNFQEYCEQHEKKFFLVTQNVDNLHQKSGMPTSHMFEVHGNIFGMRCSEECSEEIFSIPDNMLVPECPNCGENARPHVLWYDEMYNEKYFNFRSALQMSSEIDLLFVVGTTLQTNLPAQIFQVSYSRDVPIVEINPNPLGLEKYGIYVFAQSVGEVFPTIIEQLKED